MTQTNGSPVWSSTHSLPSRMPPSSTDVSRSACRSIASAGLAVEEDRQVVRPGHLVRQAGPAAVAVGPPAPLGLAILHVLEDDLVVAQGRSPRDAAVRPSPRARSSGSVPD